MATPTTNEPEKTMLSFGFTKKNIIRLITNEGMGAFLILMGFTIVLSIASDYFFTANNLTNMLRQSSWYIMIAMGGLCVFIIGQIDLSLGAVMGMSGIVSAILAQESVGTPVVVIVLVAMGIGVVLGAINGYLVGYLGMSSFIVTLGMMTSIRGAILLPTGGYPVNNLQESFNAIGTSYFFGIPSPVYIMAVICMITWYILNKTPFGRHMYATGGNTQAAQYSGIDTKRITFFTFVYSGLVSGISGMVLTARLSSGQLSLGTGFELDAIAGLVIGGISMEGGKGKVFGSICGMLVMIVLKNGMDLLNISPYWQKVVQGVIIVIAVLMDTMRKRQKA